MQFVKLLLVSVVGLIPGLPWVKLSWGFFFIFCITLIFLLTRPILHKGLNHFQTFAFIVLGSKLYCECPHDCRLWELWSSVFPGDAINPYFASSAHCFAASSSTPPQSGIEAYGASYSFPPRTRPHALLRRDTPTHFADGLQLTRDGQEGKYYLKFAGMVRTPLPVGVMDAEALRRVGASAAVLVLVHTLADCDAACPTRAQLIVTLDLIVVFFLPLFIIYAQLRAIT